MTHVYRKLYLTELRTSAHRASLHTLENEAQTLKEEISKSAREKQILLSKYQNIQDFSQLAVSNSAFLV